MDYMRSMIGRNRFVTSYKIWGVCNDLLALISLILLGTVRHQPCYPVVCCYTVVTLLLHCCYTVVTLLLHCCYVCNDLLALISLIFLGTVSYKAV
jgi:hypothetical protein